MEPIARPLTLKDFFAIARRQRAWIIIIVFGSLGLGFFAIQATKPVYRSSSSILIQAAARAGNTTSDPISNISLPEPQLAIPTQIQILQSDILLAKAYEYQKATMPESVVRRPSIKVEQVGETNVLKVNVDSTDGKEASEMALALPQVYASYVRENREGEVSKAIQFLIDRVEEEKKALKKAESDLFDYRSKRTLQPFVGEAGDRSSRVSAAELQVVQAETAVSVVTKKIDALEKEKSKLSDRTTNDMKEGNGMYIQNLKSQITDLEAKRAQLALTYLDDHESIKEIDVQLKSKRKELKEYPKQFDRAMNMKNPNIENFDMQIAAAKVELATAQKQYTEAVAWSKRTKDELEQYQGLEPQENELVGAVESRKASIAALSKNLEDFRIKRQSATDLVSVLAMPTSPEMVKPREAQYLAIALLMGCFMAVGFALLKDTAEDKVTTPDEIYALTGLPALGEIPALPKRAPSAVLAKMSDRLLDTYRVLKFNLMFSTLDTPVTSILVTSAGPGEGKTELACNLAIAASGEGKRVILVDANLRNPSIHKKMNVEGKPGLSDVVMGESTLAECLHPTAVPGLSVLTAGTSVNTPPEFLSSPQMLELVSQLMADADLVIFDAPASIGYADALVLSSVTDAVLFVAKSGTTKRANIRRGLDALRQANARVLGVALSGAA